ncbi:conserved Plasmodium protein, unknown function [Plasmodium ovale curtisi]|uniref:Uncharacterized protein n=1 Tax=Plasmodium ovale curtisi TaxID=864141 RepID=A0A1A8W621_PLAOA|nr:conserved Plasmodium protein, unknown function [Plasmodium ovale curtisi]
MNFLSSKHNVRSTKSEVIQKINNRSNINNDNSSNIIADSKGAEYDTGSNSNCVPEENIPGANYDIDKRSEIHYCNKAYDPHYMYMNKISNNVRPTRNHTSTHRISSPRAHSINLFAPKAARTSTISRNFDDKLSYASFYTKEKKNLEKISTPDSNDSFKTQANSQIVEQSIELLKHLIHQENRERHLSIKENYKKNKLLFKLADEVMKYDDRQEYVPPEYNSNKLYNGNYQSSNTHSTNLHSNSDNSLELYKKKMDMLNLKYLKLKNEFSHLNNENVVLKKHLKNMKDNYYDENPKSATVSFSRGIIKEKITLRNDSNNSIENEEKLKQNQMEDIKLNKQVSNNSVSSHVYPFVRKTLVDNQVQTEYPMIHPSLNSTDHTISSEGVKLSNNENVKNLTANGIDENYIRRIREQIRKEVTQEITDKLEKKYKDELLKLRKGLTYDVSNANRMEDFSLDNLFNNCQNELDEQIRDTINSYKNNLYNNFKEFLHIYKGNEYKPGEKYTNEQFDITKIQTEIEDPFYLHSMSEKINECLITFESMNNKKKDNIKEEDEKRINDNNSLITALNNINIDINNIENMIYSVNANICQVKLLDDAVSFPGEMNALSTLSSKCVQTDEEEEEEEEEGVRNLRNLENLEHIANNSVEGVEECIQLKNSENVLDANENSIEFGKLPPDDSIDIVMINPTKETSHEAQYNEKCEKFSCSMTGENVNINIGGNLNSVMAIGINNGTQDEAQEGMRHEKGGEENSDRIHDMDRSFSQAWLDQNRHTSMQNENDSIDITDHNCSKSGMEQKKTKSTSSLSSYYNGDGSSNKYSTELSKKECLPSQIIDKSIGSKENEKEKKKSKWRSIFSSKKEKKKNLSDNFGNDAELWSKGENGAICENSQSRGHDESSNKDHASRNGEQYSSFINTSSNNMKIEKGELDVMTSCVNNQDELENYNDSGDSFNNPIRGYHSNANISQEKKRESVQSNVYGNRQSEDLYIYNTNAVGDPSYKDHGMNNYNYPKEFESNGHEVNGYYKANGNLGHVYANQYNNNNVLDYGSSLDLNKRHNNRNDHISNSPYNANGNVDIYTNADMYTSGDINTSGDTNTNAYKEEHGNIGRTEKIPMNCSVYSYNTTPGNKENAYSVDEEHKYEQEQFYTKQKNSTNTMNFNEQNYPNDHLLFKKRSDENNYGDEFAKIADTQQNRENENFFSFYNNGINNEKVNNGVKCVNEINNQYNLFYNMNGQNEENNNFYVNEYNNHHFGDASEKFSQNCYSKTSNIKRVNSSAINVNKNHTTDLFQNNKIKLSTKSEVHYNSHKSQKNKAKKNLEDLFA